MLPAGLQADLAARMQERLAAPTTNTSQSGNISGMSSYTPGMLDTISKGLGVMGQGMQMASGMGSMFSPTGGGGMGMGLGSASTKGMGTGAAANSWFGPSSGNTIQSNRWGAM